MAIESKFTEPYARAKNEFRPSYFEVESLWDGLASVRALAHRVKDRVNVFEYLGVAQLIKHILGLSRTVGVGAFSLGYLWYEWPSPEADQHRAEVDRFRETVSAEVDFRDLTYQRLFKDLLGLPEPAPGYCRYLAERYFRSN